MNIKKWEVLPFNKEKAIEIAREHNLPSVLAMLLEARGYTDSAIIEDLIGESDESVDPFLFKDMDKAAERIQRALDNCERIAIFGDYDADGVTSTAVLYLYLTINGGDVMWYIPKRDGEGYGMNMSAVDYLNGYGVKLIVTVDNGIASIEEIAYAKKLGMDTVVTDHHRPHEILPECDAVVDPYTPGNDKLKFRDYSGAGIAFKLIQAMEINMGGDPEELLREYADIVSIGVIGDIVPLLGENRKIVRQGLSMLKNSERTGIHALLEQAEALDRDINSTSVAFTIVPRINATGRMGDSDRAVRLLITDDEDEAIELAGDVCNDNTERRTVEASITENVIESIENNDKIKYSRVIVVDGLGWHHGVVGIVAARITEKYGKPCMIIASENGMAKGSGRSVEGFNLFEAITYCDELLVKYGGHPMAAGITLTSDNIEAFREKINSYAAKKYPVMPAQKIQIDLKLNPSALTTAIPECLTALEPYGASNQTPLFGLFNMRLDSVTPVGGGNHLRLSLSRGEASVTCMKFSMDEKSFPYNIGDTLDLAVTLESKMFKGVKSLTVQVREMRLSGQDTDEQIYSDRIYQKLKLGEMLTPDERVYIKPDRNDFALLYRTLRVSGWGSGLQSLLYKMNSERFDIGKLRLCLDVMAERGLIAEADFGDSCEIVVLPQTEKVDIFASPLFDGLKQ